jgi:hypothetical protein
VEYGDWRGALENRERKGSEVHGRIENEKGRVIELTREAEVVVASLRNPVSGGSRRWSGVDKMHQRTETTTRRASIQREMLRRRKGEGVRGGGSLCPTREREGSLVWCDQVEEGGGL